jgi:predicted helicase
MKKIFKEYLNKISEITRRGDAREESYYPTLKDFLESFASALGKKIEVTVLPKRTEAGNPDFRIWDGSYHVIGYIEAKSPGTNLDHAETSDQLKRYLHTFPNVILTNFYEFRLYRNAIRLKQAFLARSFIPEKLKTLPPIENFEEVKGLFEEFFSFVLPSALTAESLSRELARRTRFLRDEVIRQELQRKQGDVYGFYEAFKKFLIPSLSEDEFADLYAQTITYGLFVARTRVNNSFNRRLAHDLIPSNIGILRDVFRYISLGRPTEQMEVIIDDIASVLNATNIQSILMQYYRQGKGDDPIMHFYETFLAEYDPETRERRGVYYTPLSVVHFIVRSVHYFLQTRFDKPDGLADESVTLLDPAAGTLTFPAEAIRLAFETYVEKYGEGGKATFLRKHILPHFYAFELLMAPYAIGHMKINFLFEALGVPLRNDERFQLYLTNTLEMEKPEQIQIPGLISLSEENQHATKVKKDEPILVILGNPPYSGISANQNDWTEILLKTDIDGTQSYYTVDGAPLRERNPKWLQDDYVKFIRFAQWKIHRAGRGIVAMITNHSYLDNPTFRGMRQSLLKSFNEIFIINLHGNSLKRETAPDGSPDENVFDIRQGVAIGIFIKHNNPEKTGVYYKDIYGLREEKYEWLEKHTPETVDFQQIFPVSPFYFFVPRQTLYLQTYLSWPSVVEIFPINSVGIVTARDYLTIRWTPDEMWTTVLTFSRLSEELARETFKLGKDTRDWKVNLAQQDVKRDGGPHREKIIPILYRPFDIRYTYYTGRSRGFHCMPRPEVMRHMLEKNLALVTTRQVKASETWQHCFVSNQILESCLVSNHTSEIGYAFPLYLYPSTDSPNMLRQEKQPNLAEWLLPELSEVYGFQPEPEQLLAYIYSVLYSPTYREKYAEELRTDFPRIPFTIDAKLFKLMSELGKRLIALHLLESPELNHPIVKYQGSGDNGVIEYVRYDSSQHRVYINSEKYFEGITPEMWDYQIGGYKVLSKYLKDRKGRYMDDPKRYIRIATAIALTMGIQKEINELYPDVESSVVQFQK